MSMAAGGQSKRAGIRRARLAGKGSERGCTASWRCKEAEWAGNAAQKGDREAHEGGRGREERLLAERRERRALRDACPDAT